MNHLTFSWPAQHRRFVIYLNNRRIGSQLFNLHHQILRARLFTFSWRLR
jgi:hypothetical protein